MRRLELALRVCRHLAGGGIELLRCVPSTVQSRTPLAAENLCRRKQLALVLRAAGDAPSGVGRDPARAGAPDALFRLA